MLRRYYPDKSSAAFCERGGGRGRKGGERGLSREPHWALQWKWERKCFLNMSWREPASCVFPSASPNMRMVKESSEHGSVASVRDRDGASKGDSPFRLMDKFGLLWESKSPFPQAAWISASNRLGNVRESQGAQKMIREQHLLLPANSDSSRPEMHPSGWKCQLASPTGVAGGRKLSPLCGTRWLLHLFSFCHQTLLFKLLGRISQ